MSAHPDQQTCSDPLDPSRVVPYRRWSDPLVDNDHRLTPVPEPDQDVAPRLWTAGLLSPEGEAPDLSQVDGPRRSWESSWRQDSQGPRDDATSTDSWLAGLVKEEKRPALNDLARAIIGDETLAVDISTILAAEAAANAANPEPPPARAVVPQKLSNPPSSSPRKASPRAEKAGRAGLSPSRRVTPRDRVTLYRAMATMFDAGVPLFAIFEFLARDGAQPLVGKACGRIARRLVAGTSLSVAAGEEPELFDETALRMLEVGYRGGQLSQILDQLASDEERSWRASQQLRAQLTYPLGVGLLTLVAVVVLPPLVLTDLLRQVVAMTARPPLLTQALLAVSALLASPWLWTAALILGGSGVAALRTRRGRTVRDNLEIAAWFAPAVGPLWRNLVTIKFVRVFAMTYRAGLPALTGLELASAATGSRLVFRVHPIMKRALLDGASLSEAFAAGGFLPPLALEAVAAGEAAGKVPRLLDSAARILEVEAETRMDAVARLIEPLVLSFLGGLVALVVLGCLLPIVDLTASL